MTVRELLEKADSKELTEWMVYYKLKNEDYEKMRGGKQESSEAVGNKILASLVGLKR